MNQVSTRLFMNEIFTDERRKIYGYSSITHDIQAFGFYLQSGWLTAILTPSQEPMQILIEPSNAVIFQNALASRKILVIFLLN